MVVQRLLRRNTNDLVISSSSALPLDYSRGPPHKEPAKTRSAAVDPWKDSKFDASSMSRVETGNLFLRLSPTVCSVSQGEMKSSQCCDNPLTDQNEHLLQCHAGEILARSLLEEAKSESRSVACRQENGGCSRSVKFYVTNRILKGGGYLCMHICKRTYLPSTVYYVRMVGAFLASFLVPHPTRCIFQLRHWRHSLGSWAAGLPTSLPLPKKASNRAHVLASQGREADKGIHVLPTLCRHDGQWLLLCLSSTVFHLPSFASRPGPNSCTCGVRVPSFR